MQEITLSGTFYHLRTLKLVLKNRFDCSGSDVYGGTNRLFNKVATKFGIEITLLHLSNLNELEHGIKKNTKVSP